MKYYKLIQNNDTFIGIITENDFRKYQKKNNILLVCDSSCAEYARHNELLYRDRSWMRATPENDYKYIDVDIIRIDKDEYDSLKSAIKSNEEIKIVNEVIEEVEDIEEEIIAEKDVTIDYIIDSKISAMSVECNKTIKNGFDIVLSDGILYHFSLTIEDQINLLNINNIINTSDEKIIYHANGERCKYFSRDDMKMIINTALDFKTYHTTYFNCLKAYIKSLRDIHVIENIKYGDSLPNKYSHAFLSTHKF